MSEKNIDLNKLNTIDFKMGPNISTPSGPRQQELVYTPTQRNNVGRSFYNILSSLYAVGAKATPFLPKDIVNALDRNAESERDNLLPDVSLSKVQDPASWSTQFPSTGMSFWDYRKLNSMNTGGAGSGFIGRNTNAAADIRSTMGFGDAPYFKINSGLADNADEQDKQYQELVNQYNIQAAQTGATPIKNKLETQEEYQTRIRNYTESGSFGRWAATTGAEAGYLSLNAPLASVLNILGGDKTTSGGNDYELAKYNSGWDIFENQTLSLSKDIIEWVNKEDPNFDGAAWFNSLPLTNEIRHSMMLKGINEMSFVGAKGKNQALFVLQSTLSKSTIEEKIDGYLRENRFMNTWMGDVVGLGADLPNMLVNDPDGLLSAAVTLGTLGAGFAAGVGTKAGLTAADLAFKASKLTTIASIGSKTIRSATSFAIGDLPAFLHNVSNLKKVGVIAGTGAVINSVADLKDQNARIAFSMVGLQTQNQFEYDLSELAVAGSIGAAFGAGLFSVGLLGGKLFKTLGKDVETKDKFVNEISIDSPETKELFSGVEAIPNKPITNVTIAEYTPEAALFVDDLVDLANTTASDKVTIIEPEVQLVPTVEVQQPTFIEPTVTKQEKLAVATDAFTDRASILSNAEKQTISTMPESSTFERAAGENGSDYATRLLQSNSLTTNAALRSVDETLLKELSTHYATKKIQTPLLKLDQIKATRDILTNLSKTALPEQLTQIKTILRELKTIEVANKALVNREVSTNPLFNTNGFNGKVNINDQIKLLQMYRENPELFTTPVTTIKEQVAISNSDKVASDAKKVFGMLGDAMKKDSIDYTIRKLKAGEEVIYRKKGAIDVIKADKIYGYKENADGSITVTSVDMDEYNKRFKIKDSANAQYAKQRREAVEATRQNKRSELTGKQKQNIQRAYLSLEHARSISPQHATFLDSFQVRLTKLGVQETVIEEASRLLGASIANLKLNPTKLMTWVDNISSKVGEEVVGSAIPSGAGKNKFQYYLNPQTMSSPDQIVSIALHELGHIYSFVLDTEARMNLTRAYSDNVDLGLTRHIEKQMNIVGLASDDPNYSLSDVNEFFANLVETNLMGGTIESISQLYSHPLAKLYSSIIDLFIDTWKQLKTVIQNGVYDDLNMTVDKLIQTADKISTRKQHDAANIANVVRLTESFVLDLDLVSKNQYFKGLLSYSDYSKAMNDAIDKLDVSSLERKEIKKLFNRTKYNILEVNNGSRFTDQENIIANILTNGSVSNTFITALRKKSPDIITNLESILDPITTQIYFGTAEYLPHDWIKSQLLSVAVLVPHRLEEFISGHFSALNKKVRSELEEVADLAEGTTTAPTQKLSSVLQENLDMSISNFDKSIAINTNAEILRENIMRETSAIIKISDGYKARSLGYSLPSLFMDKIPVKDLYNSFPSMMDFIDTLQNNPTKELNMDVLREKLVLKQSQNSNFGNKLASGGGELPYLFLEDILDTLQNLYGIRIKSDSSPWLRELPIETKTLINDLLTSPFIKDDVKFNTIRNIISEKVEPHTFKTVAEIALDLERGTQLKPIVSALLHKLNLTEEKLNEELGKAIFSIMNSPKESKALLKSWSLDDIAVEIAFTILEPKKQKIVKQKTVAIKKTMQTVRDVQIVKNKTELEKWSEGTVAKDKDGKLTVFYHGTYSKVDFQLSEMKPSGVSGLSKSGTMRGPGIYFTDTPKEANNFTLLGLSEKRLAEGTQPRVYPVYLNIKKPYDLLSQVQIDKFYEDGLEWSKAFPTKYPAGTNPSLIQFDFLKANGYDGIRTVPTFTQPQSKWLIALDQSQIRSIFQADAAKVYKDIAFPIDSIDDVYNYLKNPESQPYRKLAGGLRRRGVNESAADDIIANTLLLIATKKAQPLIDLIKAGKPNEAWGLIKTYTKGQAQEFYNKQRITIKEVDPVTGKTRATTETQLKQVPFSALQTFDGKEVEFSDSSFRGGDERTPINREDLDNSDFSYEQDFANMVYAVENSDVALTPKQKARTLAFIQIFTDPINKEKTQEDLATILTIANNETKQLTKDDIQNILRKLKEIFVSSDKKEAILSIDPKDISKKTIEQTKARNVLEDATRNAIENPIEAANSVDTMALPIDTTTVKIANTTVGESPEIVMPIPTKAKKLDKVLYATKLDGTSESVPAKTVLVSEEVATTIAKTQQAPATTQVVVNASANTIKLTAATNFMESIKDTPEAVFTSVGLNKEDLVIELSQVNNPEAVLLGLLSEQGIELVEYVKSGKTKATVVLKEGIATATNVLDNTEKKSKVRKPNQDKVVKDKNIVVDSVVTNPEQNPISINVKTGESVDTQPKIETTKSDMVELSVADKFNHEVMSSQGIYRENGADPKFAKILLQQFHTVTQNLLANLGTKIPPFSESFRAVMEQAWGIYYSIAEQNKRVYGTNYTAINNSFWKYFDKEIVSEMANKALPSDTVTLKTIDQIIATATEKTNAAIKLHNIKHGTNLPNFTAPPSPNDFTISASSPLLKYPNEVRLKPNSLGAKAMASTDISMTASSVLKEFGLTPTKPVDPPASRQKINNNFWLNKAEAQDHTAHHTTMTWLSRFWRGSVTEDANIWERFMTKASGIISNSSAEGKTVRSLSNIIRWAASYCESGKVFTHQLVATGTEAFKTFEACSSQNLRELVPIKEAQIKFDRAVNHLGMAKDIQLYMINTKQNGGGILAKDKIAELIRVHKQDATPNFINDVFEKSKLLQEYSIMDNNILIQRELDTKWGMMKQSSDKNKYHALTFDGALVSDKNRSTILNAMVDVRTKTLLSADKLDRVTMFAMGWLQDEKGNPWSFRGKSGVAVTDINTTVFDAASLKILEEKAKASGSTRYKPGTDLNKISEFQGESGRDFFSYTDPNTKEIVICKLPETKKELSIGDQAKYKETIMGSQNYVSDVWKKSPFITNKKSSVVMASMEELLDFKLRQHKYHPSIQVKEHSSAVLDMLGNGNENSGMDVTNLSWDEVFQSKVLQDIIRHDYYEAHSNFRLARGFELLVQKEIDRQLGVTGVRVKEFFESGLNTALSLSGRNSMLTEGISSGFRRIAEDYGQYAGMLHPLNSSYNNVGTQVSRLGTALIKATSGPRWGLRSLAETGLLITDDFAHGEIRDGFMGLFKSVEAYFNRAANSVEDRAAVGDLVFGMKQAMFDYERLLGEEAGSASPKLKNSWISRLLKTNEDSNIGVKLAEVIGNVGVEIGGSRYQNRGARRIAINAISKNFIKYINNGAAMRFFDLISLPENKTRLEEAQKLSATSKKGSRNIDKIYIELARKAGFGGRWDQALKFSQFNLLSKEKLESLKFAFDKLNAGKTSRVDMEQLRHYTQNYARNGTGAVDGTVLTDAYHDLSYAIETLVQTDGFLSESRGLNRDLSIRARTPLGQFTGKLLQWSQSFSSNILQNIGTKRPLSFLVKGAVLYTAYTYISDLLIDWIAGRDEKDIKKELQDPATVMIRMLSTIPVIGRYQGLTSMGLAGLSDLAGGTFSGFGDPITPPAIGVMGSYIKKAKKSVGELVSGGADSMDKVAYDAGNLVPYNTIFNSSPIAIPVRLLQKLNYIQEENMLGKYLKLIQRSGDMRNKYNVTSRSQGTPVNWSKASITDLEAKKQQRLEMDDRQKATKKAIEQSRATPMDLSNTGVSSVLASKLKSV